jgi:hypothetical protein
MLKYLFHRISLLVLISITWLLTACSPGLEYKPLFGFVILKISTSGITVSASSPDLETPIGTFTVNIEDLLSDADKQQPPKDGLLVVIRYYKLGTLVDEVHQMNTGDSKVSVTIDGRTIISIDHQRVFVDATKGNIQNIKVQGNGVTSTETLTPQPRTLTTPPQQLTLTANATGQQDGTGARAAGMIGIAYSTLTCLKSGDRLSLTFQNKNTAIVVRQDICIQPSMGTYSDVQVEADQIGAAGNHALGETFDCGICHGYIKSGFDNGQDPNKFVQPEDIDNARNQLREKLKAQAIAQLQSQMHSDESMMGDPQCDDHLQSPDHQAGDMVATFTISGDMTCTVMVST